MLNDDDLKYYLTKNTNGKRVLDILNTITDNGIVSIYERVRMDKRRVKNKTKRLWEDANTIELEESFIEAGDGFEIPVFKG